jgi:SAM-dependent methyltransferase
MLVQDSYGPIADMYDTYVRVDFDLDFFRDHTSRCAGRVLELMAGTGRVSQAIFESNPRLTCVDISREMLRVLGGKFTGVVPGPAVVCADVRSLPLESRYELAVIPFNSFAELTTAEEQRQTLAELNRVLVAGGQVICTLHNPVVRVRSLDGRERLLGRYGLERDQELELWVEGSLDSKTGVARSRQVFRIYDVRRELVREHLQQVQFVLIEQESFADLVRISGFEVLRLAGDYDGSSYDCDTSPFMIWTIKKTGSGRSSP